EGRIGVSHGELVDAPVLARAAALDLEAAELLAAQAEALGDEIQARQVFRLERGALRRSRILLGTEEARKARDQPAAAVLAVGKVAGELLRSDAGGPARGVGPGAQADLVQALAKEVELPDPHVERARIQRRVGAAEERQPLVGVERRQGTVDQRA